MSNETRVLNLLLVNRSVQRFPGRLVSDVLFLVCF